MANRLAMAIRNGFPVSPGHTLIIPKRHVAIFFETRTEAWQTILDLYFHLIPRYAGVDADPRGGVRRIFPKKSKVLVMAPDEILKAFDNIRVWQRGDRCAPHKPLLILMALGSFARGEKPRAEFAEIEGKLGRLLEEFRKTQRSRPKSRGACSMGTSPESIRQDVLDAVGLSLEPADAGGGDPAARRRDPAFRKKVLLACEYASEN